MQEDVNYHDYPSHEARVKDLKWIKAFVRAAYREISTQNFNIFYGNRNKYAEIMQHAKAERPINHFKKQLGLKEGDNQSWYAIEWKQLPILPRLRRMALNSLAKRRHEVSLNTIDPRLKKEENEHLTDIESRLKVKKAMSKINPEFAENPLLSPAENEPQDLDEFETYRQFGYKHNLVMAMESANKIILNDNEYDDVLRDLIDSNIMDFGASIIKHDIDDHNRIVLKEVMPADFVSSYIRRKDGQDARFLGHFEPFQIYDLREKGVNETNLKVIVEKFAGKYGNPAEMPEIFPEGTGNLSAYDSYKVPVLCLEFKTIEKRVFETRTGKAGNPIVRVFKGERRRKGNTYEEEDLTVVYQAKWVVGTDVFFDYGPKPDQHRPHNAYKNSMYSYCLDIPNLYDMTSTSKIEETITINNQIQIAWFKMQNEIATAVPNGWFIDFDALEEIVLGDGEHGERWDVKKVLDMFFQRGVLIGRKKQSNGKIDPNPPIVPQQSNSMQGVAEYYQTIMNHIQLLRLILGVNEYVDGTNVDAKTLQHVTQLAQEALNNSTYDIASSERKILLRISKKNVVCLAGLIDFEGRLNEAYRYAMGERNVITIESLKNISGFAMSVEIDQMPTDMERQMMLQRLTQYAGAGLIEPADESLILTAKSQKAAWAVLDARVRKRKKEQREFELQKMRYNAEANAQAGQAVEKSKQATKELEGKIAELLEHIKGGYRLEEASVKGEYQVQSAGVRAAKD